MCRHSSFFSERPLLIDLRDWIVGFKNTLYFTFKCILFSFRRFFLYKLLRSLTFIIYNLINTIAHKNTHAFWIIDLQEFSDQLKLTFLTNQINLQDYLADAYFPKLLMYAGCWMLSTLLLSKVVENMAYKKHITWKKKHNLHRTWSQWTFLIWCPEHARCKLHSPFLVT
jgi:hypothetical protein